MAFVGYFLTELSDLPRCLVFWRLTTGKLIFELGFSMVLKSEHHDISWFNALDKSSEFNPANLRYRAKPHVSLVVNIPTLPPVVPLWTNITHHWSRLRFFQFERPPTDMLGKESLPPWWMLRDEIIDEWDPNIPNIRGCLIMGDEIIHGTPWL